MGGGGGGGGYFGSQSPANIGEALRREEQKTEDQTFETKVSEEIGNLLSEYNGRDTEAVRRALDRITEALSEELEDTPISPIFGGSVRKHTYVDGISDVDALLVLKDNSLHSLAPSKVLDYFESKIEKEFPSATVERDRMSVSIGSDEATLHDLEKPRTTGQTKRASAPPQYLQRHDD